MFRYLLFRSVVLGGYIVATGGSVTIDGDYKIHTFNSSGNFQVLSGTGSLWYVVVGGGGGGGSFGGGGGGGFISNSGYSFPVTPNSYSVVVGGGGIGGAVNGVAKNGTNSSFDSILAYGGGGGGASDNLGNVTIRNGLTGGSGGGAGCQFNSPYTTGFPGNGISGQGFRGGTGLSNALGAGGGGAGEVGAPAGATGAIPTHTGGYGGAGTHSMIIGILTPYAGGGGGGGYNYRGLGGTGGGGNGGFFGSSTTGVAGVANTGGGGGGGGGNTTGAAGGSGVVIVRYRYQLTYATFNPLRLSSNALLSGGNLTLTSNSSAGVEQACFATIAVSAASANPKWYYEATWNTGGSGPSIYVGYGNTSSSLNLWLGRDGVNSWAWEPGRNYTWFNGTPLSRSGTNTAPMVVAVAYDAVSGNIWYGRVVSGVTTWLVNGVNSGNPSTGVYPSQTGLTGSLYPGVAVYPTGTNVTLNFGGSPFAGTVPTGFVAPQ